MKTIQYIVTVSPLTHYGVPIDPPRCPHCQSAIVETDASHLFPVPNGKERITFFRAAPLCAEPPTKRPRAMGTPQRMRRAYSTRKRNRQREFGQEFNVGLGPAADPGPSSETPLETPNMPEACLGT